jgi:hypothetical protein
MPLIGRENFKKLTDKGYEQANKDIRNVYLSGLLNIVEGTPVDKGRARNNWFLSVGVPSSQTTTSKSKGLGAIRQLRKMPHLVLGKKLFYTNNLPYIGVLEYGGYPKQNSSFGPTVSKTRKTSGGYSTQAPGGWVRSTLMAMRNKIRSL